MFRIKLLILCALVFAVWAGLSAQSGIDWQWATNVGGPSFEDANAIAVDSQGGKYITGSFLGTAVFGAHNLTSSGGHEIFVAKLDAQGTWAWAVSAGGASTDEGQGIAVDSSGNVYVTGSIQGTANFGSLVLTGSEVDIFAAKLDPAGNWLWAVKAGGPSLDYGYGITLDGNNDVLLTGIFRTHAYFGDFTFTTEGSSDVFVARLDSSGNWLWVKQAGGSGLEHCEAIAADSSGNIYLAGVFSNTIALGPLSLTSVGGSDVFIARLDPSGEWLWAQRAGGSFWDDGSCGIAVDGAANVYVTGYFIDTADFGPYVLTPVGGGDAWVAKLDSGGNWLWARSGGGPEFDSGMGVALDGQGTVCVTGYFPLWANFGDHTLFSAGNWDIFAVGLDANGNWLWAKSAGGPSGDRSWDVVADNSGAFYLTGYFLDACSFGSIDLAGYGESDAFVAELGSGVAENDGLVPDVASFASISGASPNPFGTRATINCSLDRASDLELEVFNLKGQLVKTLARGNFASGVHSLIWDGSDERGTSCPNGIYLLRLSAEGKPLATRKISFLK